MPLSHQTSIFNVDQCNVYKMLTDPSGGSATYSAATPVPGIKSIAINPDTLQKELYGDTKVVARGAKIRQIMGQANYAKLSLDVLGVLLGGATTDAGTTPNQTSTYDLLGASLPSYFKIEFRILQVDFVVTNANSLNVQLHKCKLTDEGLGLATAEDFSLQSFSFAAIPLLANDKMISIIENETAGALS